MDDKASASSSLGASDALWGAVMLEGTQLLSRSAEGEGWGRDRELPQCVLVGERGGGCCGKDTHSDLGGVSGDVGA